MEVHGGADRQWRRGLSATLKVREGRTRVCQLQLRLVVIPVRVTTSDIFVATSRPASHCGHQHLSSRPEISLPRTTMPEPRQRRQYCGSFRRTCGLYFDSSSLKAPGLALNGDLLDTPGRSKLYCPPVEIYFTDGILRQGWRLVKIYFASSDKIFLCSQPEVLVQSPPRRTYDNPRGPV